MGLILSDYGRKSQRVNHDGIVLLRIEKDSRKKDHLVQVINRSTDGIGVIFAGEDPPDFGDSVEIRLDNNKKFNHAIIRWKNEILEDVFILGLLMEKKQADEITSL